MLTLSKLSTGREPFRWFPLNFSSAIVCTAHTPSRAQNEHTTLIRAALPLLVCTHGCDMADCARTPP